MKVWNVNITAESDLLITARRGMGNDMASDFHIPGSTVRGALAATALAGSQTSPGQPPTTEFMQAFIREAVFTDALFCTGQDYCVKPIPLSATTCSYKLGFRVGGGHGVLDRLWETPPDRCQTCGSPLQRYSGWYTSQEGRLIEFRPVLLQRSHGEIEDHTGLAKKGNLFTRFKIARGSRFLGQIRAFSETAEAFLDKLLQNPQTLYVGKGGGRVAMTADVDLPSIPDDLEVESMLYLVLRSPAIVEDAFGRPLQRFDLECLALMTGIPEDELGVKFCDQYSSVEWVYGWNAAHRLPKSRELALSRGSCVKLSVEEAGKAQVMLKQLLERGGGFRVAEGFGQVAINPDYYRESPRGR